MGCIVGSRGATAQMSSKQPRPIQTSTTLQICVRIGSGLDRDLLGIGSGLRIRSTLSFLGPDLLVCLLAWLLPLPTPSQKRTRGSREREEPSKQTNKQRRASQVRKEREKKKQEVGGKKGQEGHLGSRDRRDCSECRVGPKGPLSPHRTARLVFEPAWTGQAIDGSPGPRRLRRRTARKPHRSSWKRRHRNLASTEAWTRRVGTTATSARDRRRTTASDASRSVAGGLWRFRTTPAAAGPRIVWASATLSGRRFRCRRRIE